MSKKINVSIMLNQHTIENSQWLKNLSFEMQKELKTPCTIEKIKNPKNTQAVDLAIALSMINVVVTSIPTIFQILSYYNNQRNKSPDQRNKISCECGKNKFQFDLISSSSLEIIEKVESDGAKEMVIKIN